MPTRNHYVQVARKLKKQLGKQAFMTLPRMEITQLSLRQANSVIHQAAAYRVVG